MRNSWLNAYLCLVFCRMVLVHLADPIAALHNMLACVKPGGSIACEEPEISSCFFTPQSAAFNQHISMMCKFMESMDADPDFGLRLEKIFHTIGLHNITASVNQPIVSSHRLKLAALLSAQNCRQQYIDLGLITEAEMDNLIQVLEEEIAAETSILTQCRMFQVSGRKQG